MLRVLRRKQTKQVSKHQNAMHNIAYEYLTSRDDENIYQTNRQAVGMLWMWPLVLNSKKY